jgi:uncharacterized YigZ family protein
MAQEPTRYPIPARTHRVEEVIQKSRFITAGAHAPNPEAAKAFLASMREEFPDATHHCWAYAAGPPGSTTSVGMSDDGEPHGTAGRPMLNTLLHGGVGEIVVVCVRYYGGTKLGTGGLTRAYSGGVKLLLESLPTVARIARIRLQILVDYDAVDGLKRLLEELEAIVESTEYGERVTYGVSLPTEHVRSLTEAVGGLTQGRGRVSSE